MELTTVVSTDGSPYLAWQTDLLAHSHRRVRQPGPLVVLSDTVRVGDDDYSPYNKPYALMRWAERGGAQTDAVLVLDPDMVFVRPFAGSAEAGRVLAHDSRYSVRGDLDAVLRAHVDAPTELPSLMVPLLVHRADLAAFARLWFETTVRLRGDAAVRTLIPWICEMWACSIAVRRLGLDVALTQLAVHPPFGRGLGVPFVHYAYEVDGFDKRRYRPWEDMPPARNAAYGHVRALAEDYRGSSASNERSRSLV